MKYFLFGSFDTDGRFGIAGDIHSVVFSENDIMERSDALISSIPNATYYSDYLIDILIWAKSVYEEKGTKPGDLFNNGNVLAYFSSNKNGVSTDYARDFRVADITPRHHNGVGGWHVEYDGASVMFLCEIPEERLDSHLNFSVKTVMAYERMDMSVCETDYSKSYVELEVKSGKADTKWIKNTGITSVTGSVFDLPIMKGTIDIREATFK